MWAFYQFVRQSVADNKPWDRFAREILTASGSTLQNGAANYFVLHKDVTDLTEATAVTFLGMSITCCRCHNHPLEKWTQDQYWGMANLFARVALKNGDRAGEVIVQSLPAGDVLHPRRGVAMPPTPLDGKPLAADSPMDRRAVFRRLADGAGQSVFRPGPGQPRLAQLPGPRPGRGRGRPARRPTRPPTRNCSTPWPRISSTISYDVKHLIRHDHELGDLPAVLAAAAGQCARTTAFIRTT